MWQQMDISQQMTILSILSFSSASYIEYCSYFSWIMLLNIAMSVINEEYLLLT